MERRRLGNVPCARLPRASIAAPAAAAWIVLAATALPAFGQTPKWGVVSVVFENDAFYKADRDYTNGLAVAWTPPGAPGWARKVADWLPWLHEDADLRHGYGFGQSMYTPKDMDTAEPKPGDRPYAGWLYAAAGVAVENDRQLDQLVLTLGVVGPASLAEQTQKFIHQHDPRGWDSQLDNEVGFVLGYQHAWRLVRTEVFGLDLDVAPHLGGAVGNVFTYADAGWTVRFGDHVPADFGPPRVGPSLPGSPLVAPTAEFGWYVFAGVGGRAVARNLFLDGNTFSSSYSVDKEPLVGDLQWGVALTAWGARLAYTHVIRTREYETQAGHDDFGAFSVSVSI